MPLSIYRCGACDYAHEVLHKVGNRPTTTVCPDCDGVATVDIAQTYRPARIASHWGDSASYFDRGLGVVVENASHKARILKERGLVCEGDLGSGAFEQSMHESYTEHKEHERTMARVNDKMAQGLSPGAAVTATINEKIPV